MGRGRIRDRRSRSLGTKLTFREEREVVHAAELEGKSASEWARDVLLQAARRPSEDVLFTELVATRMLMVNLLKPLILGKQVSQDWITEAMAAVRREKRKAARDLMHQYTDDTAGGQ
jgi:hypothetical protein